MKRLSSEQLTAADRATSDNRHALAESVRAGCFGCLRVFAAAEVHAWALVDADDEGDGDTALCPYCTMDMVIPEVSGIPLTHDHLRAVRRGLGIA
jgi:hypothetical protein